MPVHYHISEKLKVMNNLVKWIWLRENHAGKLKWFVLTSLPPKTFSKPTPSWGTNSEKNMFSKGKKLSTSKTFVQLLQHAKLEEVLSTCFKMLLSLLQPVCYESVGQAVTWSPLSIGCCLPMPWFSFYAPAHWPLSANITGAHSYLSVSKHTLVSHAFQRKSTCCRTS